MKRGHVRLNKKLKQMLPLERFMHVLRSVKIAESIAKLHGANSRQVEVGALLHDCSRFMNPKDMLAEARRLGLKIDKIQRFEPKLLHAELSAYYARRRFGIKNQGILNAIRSHTVGNNNMSLLDKIVYLADHIEEDRNYKGVKRVKTLANKNLDQAIVESLNITIKHLIELGMPVHEQTIKTRNSLILKASKTHV